MMPVFIPVLSEDLTDDVIQAVCQMMKEMDLGISKSMSSSFYLRMAQHDLDFYKEYVQEICTEMRLNNTSISGFVLLREATSQNYVGFLQWDLQATFENGVHINDIYIKQEFRRKGYASFGLRKTLEWIKETYGITQVELEVLSNNIPALKLYKKFGFNTTLKYVLVKK